MMNTVWGIVQDGRIVPQEPIELHDGQRVLVTILGNDEDQFWMSASDTSLNLLWDNVEDDVYAELLAA